LRIPGLSALLNDPVRAVRIEAARLLAPVAASLGADAAPGYAQALAEFETVQAENRDRPEAHTNLGNLYLSRNDPRDAENAYRAAIALDPRFVPAYVNLADLYRASGRDSDAETALRNALRVVPAAAPLHEALGLTLVRQGRHADALNEFSAAVAAAPDNARHTYVYAVALHGAGRVPEALAVLHAFAERSGDRDVLLALGSFQYEAGDRAGAEKTLRKLAEINPDDPALGQPTQ
jgi:Flp pilus assembly protein TadD